MPSFLCFILPSFGAWDNSHYSLRVFEDIFWYTKWAKKRRRKHDTKQEDYLKCIYEISFENRKKSATKEIALSRILRSLHPLWPRWLSMISEGLLVKDKSRGVFANGSRIAVGLWSLPQHRLIEEYFFWKRTWLYSWKKLWRTEDHRAPFLNISLTSWITCLELLRPPHSRWDNSRKAKRKLSKPNKTNLSEAISLNLYILQGPWHLWIVKMQTRSISRLGILSRFNDMMTTQASIIVIHGQKISINQWS